MLDYDNDGWMDLLVTNDTEPNKLYHNNHNGTFTDVGVAAGIAKILFLLFLALLVISFAMRAFRGDSVL